MFTICIILFILIGYSNQKYWHNRKNDINTNQEGSLDKVETSAPQLDMKVNQDIDAKTDFNSSVLPQSNSINDNVTASDTPQSDTLNDNYSKAMNGLSQRSSLTPNSLQDVLNTMKNIIELNVSNMTLHHVFSFQVI